MKNMKFRNIGNSKLTKSMKKSDINVGGDGIEEDVVRDEGECAVVGLVESESRVCDNELSLVEISPAATFTDSLSPHCLQSAKPFRISQLFPSYKNHVVATCDKIHSPYSPKPSADFVS